jgi:glyceraldehyde-3-phosphate dehydrogenase/erythrose-4-phosphate dehydrogenase
MRTVEKATSADRIDEILRKWANRPMKEVLAVDDSPIVSSDIIRTEESAIVSSQDAQVMEEGFISVLAWYDNEWAVSRRRLNMMTRML